LKIAKRQVLKWTSIEAGTKKIPPPPHITVSSTAQPVKILNDEERHS